MSTATTAATTRPRPDADQNIPKAGLVGTANQWPDPAADRTAAQRVRHRVRTGMSELRFVSQRPPSLLEHVAYAQRGEWTDEIDGGRRHTAVLFAWLIAIPVSTVAYFAAWAAARPGRFLSVVVVGMLVSTALAQIPGLEWLIPGWARL